MERENREGCHLYRPPSRPGGDHSSSCYAHTLSPHFPLPGNFCQEEEELLSSPVSSSVRPRQQGNETGSLLEKRGRYGQGPLWFRKPVLAQKIQLNLRIQVNRERLKLTLQLRKASTGGRRQPCMGSSDTNLSGTWEAEAGDYPLAYSQPGLHSEF